MLRLVGQSLLKTKEIRCLPCQWQCRLFSEEKGSIPFRSANLGPFFQKPAELRNQFLEDALLQRYLTRLLPGEVQKPIFGDLEQFGNRVATDIYDWHLQCERDPPRLQQFDAWGNRTDEIITCEAWKKMHDISAQEGLIAIAYERKFQQWSRIYQVAKLYLYNPSAGLYSCPLAMTDGAAKILEDLGDPALMSGAYTHLISRDPATFWTSGQWMTERRGGSDVANGTETVAVAQSDGSYKLYGYKWFSSATDSDMTMTLARVMDQNGQTVDGTKGLSLFYLETKTEDGKLNSIQVQKLKNKLGTRQLPTAELLLDGAKAIKISPEGRGVASIATMLTVTRIHNSLAAVGAMRRVINLARDYSTKRDAFGQKICNYPLHMQTIARLEVETRGAFLLVMEVARLLGLDDCKMKTERDQQMLRLLTPLLKLYTGKQGVSVASEGLECFGGQGYIEDTGLPAILRDVQVCSIWEGTTNILSLDVLRCIAKSHGAVLHSFHSDVSEKLLNVSKRPNLMQHSSKVQRACDSLMDFLRKNADMSILEIAARDLAYSLSRIYIATLLLDHAYSAVSTPTDVAAAIRWCSMDLTPVLTNASLYGEDGVKMDNDLVMDGFLGPQ
ncbi:acyl-CoA dehydrogenase family member 11-like [Lineus longissimus]|uniref:acyl-CoA dehydrogenase family member 11-like n=1 Tax=Lineus longissimus TaxID=88925 RepID=UPI00315D5190